MIGASPLSFYCNERLAVFLSFLFFLIFGEKKMIKNNNKTGLDENNKIGLKDKFYRRIVIFYFIL